MKDMLAKKNNHFTVLFISVFILISCEKNRNLELDEYVKHIENIDNGFCVEKEIDELNFKLIYKPIDYVLSYELRNGSLSKDSVNVRKVGLKGYQYFTLQIRSKKDNEILKSGIQNENEYFERLEYFMSAAQDDLFLIDGLDTLPCLVYHFERNYGLAPTNNMLLAFEEKKNSQQINDKKILFDEKVLGVGKILISIKANDLEKLPTLKLN